MFLTKQGIFNNKRALTLTEVMVGAVIVASVFVGLISAIVSVRKLNLRSLHRLQATHLAREVLESLYDDVREDWWSHGTGGLSLGSHNAGSVVIDGINYSRSYTVSSTTTSCRMVTVNVTWQE